MYQEKNKSFYETIQRGVKENNTPWTKDFTNAIVFPVSAQKGNPQNNFVGDEYNGINVLLLYINMLVNENSGPRHFTSKTIEKYGLRLKENADPLMVIYSGLRRLDRVYYDKSGKKVPNKLWYHDDWFKSYPYKNEIFTEKELNLLKTLNARRVPLPSVAELRKYMDDHPSSGGTKGWEASFRECIGKILETETKINYSEQFNEKEIATLSNKVLYHCYRTLRDEKSSIVYNEKDVTNADGTPLDPLKVELRKDGDLKCKNQPMDKLIEYADKMLKEINPERGGVYHDINTQVPSFNLRDYRVKMPLREQFNSDISYYYTIAHEITHAMRKVMQDKGVCQMSDYAGEELIVETSAILLASIFGFAPNPDQIKEIKEKTGKDILENSYSYLRSWSNHATKLSEGTLDNDGKEVMQASEKAIKAAYQEAEKTVDYITKELYRSLVTDISPEQKKKIKLDSNNKEFLSLYGKELGNIRTSHMLILDENKPIAETQAIGFLPDGSIGLVPIKEGIVFNTPEYARDFASQVLMEEVKLSKTSVNVSPKKEKVLKSQGEKLPFTLSLTEDGSGYTIESFENLKKIVVPEQYEGKPIVSIKRGAFSNCPNLKSLQVPFSVDPIKETDCVGCRGDMYISRYKGAARYSMSRLDAMRDIAGCKIFVEDTRDKPYCDIQNPETGYGYVIPSFQKPEYSVSDITTKDIRNVGVSNLIKNGYMVLEITPGLGYDKAIEKTMFANNTLSWETGIPNKKYYLVKVEEEDYNDYLLNKTNFILDDKKNNQVAVRLIGRDNEVVSMPKEVVEKIGTDQFNPIRTESLCKFLSDKMCPMGNVAGIPREIVNDPACINFFENGICNGNEAWISSLVTHLPSDIKTQLQTWATKYNEVSHAPSHVSFFASVAQNALSKTNQNNTTIVNG